MGCRFISGSSSADEKVLYYEKYVIKTRLSSPLSHKEEIENNPLAWNSFVIERLHKLNLRNQWQTYTAELIKLLEEKPLEQYVRGINSKSWLSLLEIHKPEKKLYKTSYDLPKDPKYAGELRNKPSNTEQEITRLREKLLNEITVPSHIISEILARFSELFLSKYIIFFSVEPGNDMGIIAKSFRSDILILMRLIQDMIEKWYLNIILQIPALAKNRNRRQDFLDVLINLTIFSNGNNIYYTLHNLYGLTNNENERKLDSIMDTLRDIRPENMDINRVFALENSKEPYQNVINLLNEQSSHISAYEKFLIICRVKNEIMESIERYWEEWDPNIPAQKLMIDSDQLLTIMTFCIVKTRNCKLISYLAFIREFMGKNLMENSYYFTTYDAAMNYLIKLSERELNEILER